MAGADASLPLQKAIVKLLKADAAVSGIVGESIFDAVPANAKKPYVSLGPSQIAPDLADEYEGAAERLQIDCWSAGPGKVEVKKLAAAIHAALHDAPLALDGDQRLVYLRIEQTQYMLDPDSMSEHGVLIFTAATEPAN